MTFRPHSKVYKSVALCYYMNESDLEKELNILTYMSNEIASRLTLLKTKIHNGQLRKNQNGTT